jgi:hypothetical protein
MPSLTYDDAAYVEVRNGAVYLVTASHMGRCSVRLAEVDIHDDREGLIAEIRESYQQVANQKARKWWR